MTPKSILLATARMLIDAEAKAGKELLASSPAQSARSIPIIWEIGEPLEDLINMRQVDLVVLSTDGHRALASMMLGSTAQYLLTRLPVDVLSVRGSNSGATVKAA